MIKYFVAISLLFLFGVRCSYAQEVVFTLERTIAVANDSSLLAFSSKNLYQASLWEYRAYKAGRLPSLVLTSTPLKYNRDFTRRYDSENDVDVYRRQQSLYASGGLSVRQNLDLTGGTFFIDTDLGYMRSYGNNTYTQFTTTPVRIGYSQNLFGFNSFKWERKVEPIKYEKAKRKYLYNREAIAESSTLYFFELAMARSEYNMAVDNVASSDTLYKIGEERYKIATISQSDLLTLKLDAINARNSLTNAESNLKRAAFNFLSFLNMDENTQVQLELPERPGDLDISVDTAMQYAREYNPDFLEYQQTILEAEREVDRASKSANFDASFYASIGFNQVANELSAAYANPSQQDIISIGLSVPIVDWGVRKGKVNMAKNNLNVAQISVEQRRLTLEQDILMTVGDFKSKQSLILSAEEALSLANMAYSGTRQRFMIGKADISSLTLSLNRQKEAQKNYIAALRDYWLSYYKIRKLTLFDFERGESLSQQLDKAYGL